MTCKRGHGKFFQIKLVGRKTKFCDFILAYRMKEGKEDSALFCSNLKKGAPIPKGYSLMGSVPC